ncbi:MAG: hypothetical protein ACRDZN_10195 [Acidimicrobiales bacterium]
MTTGVEVPTEAVRPQPPRASRSQATIGDPVGAADRLRAGVAERIAHLLDDAAHPLADVYVGWHAAGDVATCPARYRGQGPEGWGFPGWSAPLAAAAVGRAALAHHLEEADRSGRPPALPDPLPTIRRWMRALRAPAGTGGGPPVERPPVGEWIAETWSDGDTATLTAVAATAGRWLAGFVRVLGWPLPPQLRLRKAYRPSAGSGGSWRPASGSPVKVDMGADAELGRRTGAGRFALVVHRVTTADDASLRDRAAFEATAGALALGITPAAVLVTAGDTGDRARVTVDDELLTRGSDLVVGVVRHRAIAVERGFDPVDASPSPACRRCEHLAACPPGQAWITGPGRWRGGLPVL